MQEDPEAAGAYLYDWLCLSEGTLFHNVGFESDGVPAYTAVPREDPQADAEYCHHVLRCGGMHIQLDAARNARVTN